MPKEHSVLSASRAPFIWRSAIQRAVHSASVLESPLAVKAPIIDGLRSVSQSVCYSIHHSVTQSFSQSNKVSQLVWHSTGSCHVHCDIEIANQSVVMTLNESVVMTLNGSVVVTLNGSVVVTLNESVVMTLNESVVVTLNESVVVT